MLKKHTLLFTRCISLCLLVFFTSGDCKGQDMPPFKKGTDTAAINQSIRIAQSIPDPDSAIQKLRQIAQKSIEGDFFLGAARALCSVGSKYSDRSYYQEAFRYCTQALSYAEKSGNNSIVAYCHNLFGTINLMQGNYAEASKEYFEALASLKKIEGANREAAITIYTNLAGLSGRLGQDDKRLFYLNQGEILARNKDIQGVFLAALLINKGNYFLGANLDSAIGCYMEVLDITKKMDPEKKDARTRYQALAEINIGEAFFQKGEYEKAVSYCQYGIALAENKYNFIAAVGSYTLGNSLRHLKRYKEAEAVLTATLKKNASSNLKDQVVVGYGFLEAVYEDTKQYKKALDCMDSLFVLNDTLMSVENVKAIKQVEAKYNMAEKDRQIAQNELLIAQQKNKITRTNIWIGSVSAGVLLLIILSTGLYRNSRLKQAGIIKSLKQENTISILKGVVQGEENERIRLARELHDGIGGMLSATKMRFMALRHDNEDLVRSPRYLEAMGLLDIMGDEIRKTSHNLMPEVLLKQNLADALRTYCNSIQAGTELHVDFQSFGSFDNLPNDFKLNIYRIIQELLKNTLQHAKATYAVVQLMMLKDYLTISVEDNGTGFNTDETKDGIGLHNLKTRVLSLEGHYTLKSEPGKGTTVYIEFGMPTGQQSA